MMADMHGAKHLFGLCLVREFGAHSPDVALTAKRSVVDGQYPLVTQHTPPVLGFVELSGERFFQPGVSQPLNQRRPHFFALKLLKPVLHLLGASEHCSASHIDGADLAVLGFVVFAQPSIGLMALVFLKRQDSLVQKQRGEVWVFLEQGIEFALCCFPVVEP